MGSDAPLSSSARTTSNRKLRARRRPVVKPTLLWLHRWAGIVTGLVVVIVCVTGTILAFEDEYRAWQNPQRYGASAEGWPASVQNLLDQAVANEQGYRATSISFYPSSDRPASIPIRAEEGPRKTVYLHIDGTVVESAASTRDFMSWTMRVHRGFVGGAIGRAVVGISTIVFILILLTAIPLWWPRTMKRLWQGLTIKWEKATWTRRIYDLHVSLGMWSLALLLIMAVTGLPFGYRWAGEAFYVLTNSEKAPAAPSSALPEDEASRANLDQIMAIAQGIDSSPARVSLSVPSSPEGVISVRLYPRGAAHDRIQDTYYFDQYTGASLGALAHADLSLGARLRRGVYPWHVGSMWGLPSKVLWGFVCLLGGSFPVTGFLMWYRRQRRRAARDGAPAASVSGKAKRERRPRARSQVAARSAS